jgi:hypothetical protein
MLLPGISSRLSRDGIPFFVQLQTNYMSKLSKRHFWEWFKRHDKEYLELNKKSKKEADYWLSELTAHLRVYFRYFGFSLSLPDNGPASLTITVNGKAKHFKKVETFVAKAPELPGWTIIALEDPMPIDFLLEKEIKRTGIHPGEFYFSFDGNDPEDTDIIVYHPLCTEENKSLFLQLAYAAVYNLLGERSFGIDLGHLEVDNLSYADPEEVYQLSALPTHIDLRRSAMAVDQHGTLLSKH